MCRLDDAPMLAAKLKNKENILFSFGLDGVNAYVMSIIPQFTKTGVMPFGGNPAGSYLVSLLYRGMYYFNLDNELDPSYVGQKLNLMLPGDVTTMLNAIGKELLKD